MSPNSPLPVWDYIQTAAEWLVAAKHVVIFTGAGLSTASGLPDYRGPDGVWTRRDAGLPPPVAKRSYERVQPNEGHHAIVELERLGKVQLLISQNVDGLHIRSGFPPDKIAELHGNKNYYVCLSCARKFTREEIGWDEHIHGNGYRTSNPVPGQPSCTGCGGRVISSIVNFGDSLPADDLSRAIHHAEDLCDLFIVLGSSLVVNPAASLVHLAKKHDATLIINNMGETPYDVVADMLVAYPINDFFPPVVEKVKEFLQK